MIKVTIPNNHLPERKYILNILLKEFIGISYEIEANDTLTDYLFTFNDNSLIVKDHFFSRYEEGGYLKEKSIPSKITHFSNDILGIEKLPILFGNASIVQKATTTIVDFDIFASSFFMLTRWEEYVVKTRDSHNRFPLRASLAFKEGFYTRPIVNEYGDLLFTLLRNSDTKLEKKTRAFKIIATHDIDDFRMWNSLSSIRRTLAHNFITQRRIITGLKNIKSLLLTTLKVSKDPYDTFEYLSDLLKKYNTTAYFFFMAGGTSKYDNRYEIDDQKVKSQILKLKDKKHHVGIHPSYNSYKDETLLKKEIKLLSKICQKEISSSRQHYLRFSVPYTWAALDNAGITMDSTLVYPEYPGFRCGTCYEYQVFDILSRKQLKLKEYPLILMERSLTNYMNASLEESKKVTKTLMDKVKTHQGNFIFLWHNSTLFTEEFKTYRNLYHWILKQD